MMTSHNSLYRLLTGLFVLALVVPAVQAAPVPIAATSPGAHTWQQPAGHARPAIGGYYTGSADHTYTVTVQCANPGGCSVGSDTWTLAWNDGAGANTTNLLVVNPTETTLSDAHLFLEFVNISGTVVSEVGTIISSLPPGPTMAPVAWDTAAFERAHSPYEDYIVMAFWTDYAGNILNTSARPLSSFQVDPKPTFAMATSDETWDFGTAAQGTVMKRSVTLANIGALDLLTYVSAPAGLSVSQTGSRTIAPGDTTTYEIVLNTASSYRLIVSYGGG